MLKLYFSPGACSLAPHITLREAGLEFELGRVNLATKQTEDGLDFNTINPKGYVPALRLDDGQILTEAAVTLQYIADLKPESKLAPAPGSFARVRLQEWLQYIASELHKGVGPLYSKDASEEYKLVVKNRVNDRLDFVGKSLAGRPFLFGDGFSIADAYMVYAMRAFKRFAKLDVPQSLADYQAALLERPAVKAAFAAEGL
jgi:glutathione S-transferase